MRFQYGIWSTGVDFLSFISSMMRRVLDGMSPEEKKEFIDEITEEMFQNMTAAEIEDILSAMMPQDCGKESFIARR